MLSEQFTKQEFTCEATGTVWRITMWSNQDCNELWQSCVRFIDAYEACYSRFQKDSLVSQLSGVTGTFEVTDDFMNMLRLYKNIYYASDGAFTPIGGQTLSDLGYDAEYSFKVKREVAQAMAFEDVVQEVDDHTIALSDKVYFDFGAIGKGYLADLVLAKCKDHDGVVRVLINAGGDILHWSKEGEKINVGMENPFVEGQVVGVYSLGNEAIACSASHKRSWKDKHHIYNAHTGESVRDIRATWVVAKNAAIADALATALFITRPQALKNLYAFEYAMINQQQKIHFSGNFEKAIFHK